jgi:methionine sulfoxide reductase catalytic subunit
MHVRRRHGWELSEHLVSPEALVLGRRAALAGAGSVALAAPALAQGAPEPARNPKYVAGRDITPEKYATTYNNYYEFSEGKNLWEAAQVMKPRPWMVSLEGELKQPRTIDIDDLLKQVQLEERVYRHRCVEAWAMTVPWTGFPLSQLLKLAEPLGSAKYIVFETAQDPKMPGLQSPFYPWPYIEGLAMDEAANDLAFISTGMYGKALPPQDGGPIRLTVPWKYGFKSAKALAKISFTEKRPMNFWQAIQPSEYGFWANVNPAVSHPRWSQAQERLLGSNEMVPTQIYNGYGEFVASLYSDRKSEKLFM